MAQNEDARAARIAELEKELAELKVGAEPATAPGKSLADAVAKWKQGRPMANEPPDSTAKELNAKFAASGGTFTFTYGDVTMFFAGLEGFLGSPSPEVMPTMTLEHASTEPFKAWNSDVERLTTPKAEWAYVTEGTAGTADSAEKDAGGPRRPSHISDGSGDRKGWKLEDFAKQAQIKKAGLLLAEVAGLRSYTCAAAIRIGPVCPTSHMHPPDARRRTGAQCTCTIMARCAAAPRAPT